MATMLQQLKKIAQTDKHICLEDGTSISFGDFYKQTQDFASRLYNIGVRKGDKVSILLPTGIEYVLYLYACIQLGAVAVNINTRYRAAEIGYIIDKSDSKFLVTTSDFNNTNYFDRLSHIDPKLLGKLETLIDVKNNAAQTSVFGKKIHAHIALKPYDGHVEYYDDPDLPVVMFPTSGTTSQPKLVVHLNRNVARHAADIVHDFAYDTNEPLHFLQAVPFCGIWGFSQWIATVAAQAEVTLIEKFDASVISEIIRTDKVTHIHASDDMLLQLLSLHEEQYPFPTLKTSLYASFNPGLTRFMEEANNRGLTLINGFGMTEAFSFFSRRNEDDPVEKRKTPGGRPVGKNVQLRVACPDTGITLPHGDIGLLQIKSEKLFVGYFNDDLATKKAFTDDGYFISGDLGITYADGTFDQKGRAGDFMRLGGFLVNPGEVEVEVEKFISGQRAVIVDEITPSGNRAVLVIEGARNDGVDVEAMLRHLKLILADYKVPKRIAYLAQFPEAIGANGSKIQRNKIRAMLASGQEE